MTKKDAARLQNLALRPEGRVSIQSRCQPEIRSFWFSFWLGFAILMQDHPWSNGVVGGFKRLLNNVIGASDLLGFIECCSAVRFELVQSGRWDGDHLRSLNTRWVRGLVTAIEHAVPTSLATHPSPQFDALVTFLGWLKRLPVCIQPQKDAVKHLLDCDERLSSIDFDENVYIHELEEVWREWFENFELSDPFIPRHGSGSTADVGRVRSDKWERLAHDRTADVCFRFSSLEKALTTKIEVSTRTSKVVFVPKQAGKNRAICMEPSWLQYLQQGVARQLIDYTHGHHPLSRMVNIFSQEINRRLCADAFTHQLATIDLSDASDSVSWRLIKRLTHKMPLQRYLYGSRSFSTSIFGVERKMDKFAPMGSALCFPIECYVFASVVEVAYRRHYGKASMGHRSGCSVYGDDIIVPQEIYHLVVDILESIGFTVNMSKSFSSGAYFESCGVEYLYGALINTVRHPRAHLFVEECVSHDRVGLVSDLANSLLSAGYFTARRILLSYYQDKLVQVGPKQVAFGQLIQFDEKHCVPIVDDFSPRRWSSKLQRSGKVQLTVETTPGSTIFDYTEYQESHPPRSRHERLKNTGYVISGVDEKWSQKAVLFLAKTHFWDLLEEGELKEVGAPRTGRLRSKLRKRFLS